MGRRYHAITMNSESPHEHEGSTLVQLHRDELVGRLARSVQEDGKTECLPGLFISRISSFSSPVHGVSLPSFCVIAQGAKEVYLGDECYHYDPYRYLLSTIELPIVIQQIEASPERPHLSLLVKLEPSLVASVMLEAGMPPQRWEARPARALDVSPLEYSLLDATVRLVRLLDARVVEAQVLLPLVKREIVLRLLMGKQGARLRQLALLGGETDRMARAIEKLRVGFDKPLNIEGLAKELGMSSSGFYEHFKAVTAMTPLQFQKQLRLQEARRLLLSEDLDVTTAGYRVGYEDPSQFSKEYKRLFGQPPLRDAQRLRQSFHSASAA